METYPSSGILVEAEAFDDYGGWTCDSQFELEMGSPYLLAHGNGRPVKDASTTVTIPDAGRYHVWVRAKDWVPGHHPGSFAVAINGTMLEHEFGKNDRDWSWEVGPSVELPAGPAKVVLHDLTGFCARCDAIFLSRESLAPPNGVDEAMRAWRRRLRGLPDRPVDAGSFDVVVVGGGVPGITAALTAAALGLYVALVHDRPLLGGNASLEIGLHPRGVRGWFVDEIAERDSSGDLVAKHFLKSEPKVTVFLEHKVYNAITHGSTIKSIDARDARSGLEVRVSAPMFIDCSGRALFAQLAGAEALFGQESRAEYGEPLAPVRGESTHHGNTVFFRTRMADHPVSFPPVPWATEVAKDYSNLGGQLDKPDIENGDGPAIISSNNDNDVRRRMKRPMTHFWEYGQYLDPYTHGEHIRDHLLRAIYGTFSNVKTGDPHTYANLELDHVAFVAAQGEFRRYKGAHVLTENDIRTHRAFDDAVVQNGGAFCLHYPGHPKYDFRLKDWGWDERDGKDYDIPFRCLYSCNTRNLMMAGKHISGTHVANSNTKFMGNGSQHAVATAAAASLCKKHGVGPQGVYERHLAELKASCRDILDGKIRRAKSRL